MCDTYISWVLCQYALGSYPVFYLQIPLRGAALAQGFEALATSFLMKLKSR